MKLKFELPEIETFKRDLEREFLNRKIKAVDIKSMKVFPDFRTKKDVTPLLEGGKVELVERNKMSIYLVLNNGNTLVLRLGDGAELSKGAKARDNKLAVSISFTQGGDLKIWDKPLTTKIWVVDHEGLPAILDDPDRTGIDLQSEPMSWVDFGRLVLSYELPHKVLLMDQSIFVGISDIYSDEILFDAGLMYDRPSNKMATQEIRRLYRSTVGILHEAAKYGGTSLPDRPFRNILAEEGLYGEHLAVFGKAGELSPRSRTEIKKARFKNKTVYFCSTQV